MTDPTPTLLFRFRSLSGPSKEYTKHSVTRSEIYFSNPASLNDPYDCQISLDTQGTEKEWRKHVFRAVKHGSSRKLGIHDRIQLTQRWMKEGKHKALDGESFGRITSRFGVACFSGIMSETLMWSHYADNHRGICLMYEPDKDRTQLLKTIAEVNYQRTYPRVRVVDLAKADEKTAISLLLTKSSEWRYENEYRILLPRGAKRTLAFSPQALVGIILGSKISKQDEEEVKSWAVHHPARPIIHYAGLNHGHFGMSLRDKPVN